MKKLYFILFIIFVTLIHNSKLLGQCNNCNTMHINLPQNWGSIESGLQEATYVVKSVGLNYLYDVYLTYSSDNIYYKSSLDTFEVVHNFTLPKEAAIVDSWLWVDNLIMKAQILDRNAAFNIYEGIVKRRKDPSILYKNSDTQYEFRIFPLPYGKTRKVKLSILMPAFIEGKHLEAEIPFSLIKSSNKAISAKIISYDKDNSTTPLLSTNAVFQSETSTEFGLFKSTIVSTLQYNSSKVLFKLNTNKSQGQALFTAAASTNSNQGIFHMQIDPAYLFKDLNFGNKKVAILLDHNSNNTSTTKDQIKSSIKAFVSKMSSQDQIRLYYTKLNVKEATTAWVKIGDLNLDEMIMKLDPGNSSLLISGLNKMYADLKDDKAADIVVFSSDASITSVKASQQLKDDLLSEYGELNKTLIFNYASINNSIGKINYENISYAANELFYKILASNTKGVAVNLSTFYSTITSTTGIDQLIASLKGISYEYFQYYLKPKNGICYDIYSYKNGSKTVYFGKYKGQLPLTLDYTFLVKDSVQSNTIVSEDFTTINSSTFATQVHSAQKIRNLEEQNIYENKSYITELSLEHRVLSRHTAFLALDPNLQEPCFDCKDEEIIIATDDKGGNQQNISSYPNPFIDKVVLKLTNSVADEVKSIQLYDITGRPVLAEFVLSQVGEDVEILFETKSLHSGVYIIKFYYKGKLYTMKVVKA